MKGSTTAAIHSIATERGVFVLKRFVYDWFVAEEPDRAAHEAAGMDAAAAHGIPAPRAVALDPDGDECGAPALLMTRLPGVPRPIVPGPESVAEVLAAIHAMDSSLPWTFARYNDASSLVPPPWAAQPALWNRAFETARSIPPPGPHGFIHRDFHQDNLLWQGSSVSGVVDWLSACTGPRALDVAHCQLNLELRGQSQAADAFLGAARTLGIAHHPYWLLVDAIDMLPFYAGPEAVGRWSGPPFSPAARTKLESIVERSLAELQ